MAKIDLEKWVCSMIENFPDFKERGRMPMMYEQALKDQGLQYKDGQIVEISENDGVACEKEGRVYYHTRETGMNGISAESCLEPLEAKVV